VRFAAVAGMLAGLLALASSVLPAAGPALFFYMIHFFIYRGLQNAWVQVTGLAGHGLPAVYLGWVVGLVLLYPACLMYGQFKRMTPPGSPWRLF
jgi:hypothetical protein